MNIDLKEYPCSKAKSTAQAEEEGKGGFWSVLSLINDLKEKLPLHPFLGSKVGPFLTPKMCPFLTPKMGPFLTPKMGP